MRNAAIKSSASILQAYTTEIVFEGTRYCVTGKALVEKDKLEEFSEQLTRIKSRAVKPTGVKSIRVLVSK